MGTFPRRLERKESHYFFNLIGALILTLAFFGNRLLQELVLN